MMGKIQDKNIWYSLLRPFVDAHTYRSFKKCIVKGRDNIPKDGACIFGSNHCCTLMDAMVLLQADRKKKVFIARADIFKNPKIAKILKWLRILPIYRMRDGIGAVRDKNGDTIEQAVDVIHDQVPLYLFPEATHRPKHSLRPLSKGIFHIALEANKKFGNEKPVYIVPVGLEYSDYYRYRSNVLVTYGTPINVTDFVKTHEGETEAMIINQLKQELTEKMSKLISYIPDGDEDYDAIWEIAKLRTGQKPKLLKEKLESNQDVIFQALQMRKNEPEKARELFEKVNEFTEKRKKKKISVYSVVEKISRWSTFKQALMVLVSLPYYLAATVLTCPIWIITKLIINKLKDKAFATTVGLCVEIVLHPLLVIAGLIVLFGYIQIYIALLAIFMWWTSYMFYVDFNEYVRLWASDVRWIFNRKLRKEFENLELSKTFKVVDKKD